jgi:MFS family permease
VPLIDLRPLRQSAPFRTLAGVDAVLGFGGEVAAVAVPLQVFALTRSTLAVGLLGLSQLGANLVAAPLGGVITDRSQRRTVLLVGLVVMSVAPLLLAASALGGGPPLAALYALAAIRSASESVVSPASRSTIPFVLPPHLLVPAQAVEFLSYGAAGMVGPVVAGTLIASHGGYTAAYIVDAAAFALAIPLALRLPRFAPLEPGGVAVGGLTAIREGLAYAARSPGVRGVFLVDSCAMVFGNPVALFPALGDELGAGSLGTALLYAALPAGSLVATLTSGWTSGVRRDGRVICIAAGAWGIAVTGAGLAPQLWLAFVCIAAAGAGDSISGMFRSAIVQRDSPPALRGRISGLEWAQVTAGPAIGDVEGGVVGRLAGPRVSIVSGGLLCAVGVAAIAVASPAFWHHTREPGVESPE